MMPDREHTSDERRTKHRAIVSRGLCALCLAMAAGVSCARSYYVPVAEGLTSPSMNETMRVAPRLFSAPDLADACRSPRRVARLEAPAGTLDLRVGDQVALSTLRVVAVGEAGAALSGVPVVIEAEELNPALVELRSDDPDLNEGRLRTVGSGTFRMRVRTLCTPVPAELIITGRVAE